MFQQKISQRRLLNQMSLNKILDRTKIKELKQNIRQIRLINQMS